MNALVLVTLAFLSPTPARQEPPRSPGLPLKVPEGWERRTEEGAVVLTPKGLAAGTLYTVLVPTLSRKIGSLQGLVDAGKETLGEVGTFKPSKAPVRATNDAGWDYDLVIGRLEKGEGAVLGQIVALQKGNEEGLVLLVTDSVETWEKHSDAFTAMIRSLGGPAPGAGRASKVDLTFRLPDGWTKKEEAGSTLLEGSEKRWHDDGMTVFRLLILPSEPLTGSLRKTFLDLWAVQVKPAVETSLLPLPFMIRLKSGAACAFDMDEGAANKQGAKICGGLYVVARGNRVVPILAFFIGYAGKSPGLEKAVAAVLDSAEIPDAGTDAVAQFSSSDLEGEWSESSSSFANYVTPAGAYAGDASITTGAWMILNKDATFKHVQIAITSKTRVKETDEGTWKLEGNAVVLTGKEKARRYTLFAFGTDPKVGAFLVRSSYSNTDELPDLCRPRRAFSGTWFKRKG